MMYMADMRSHMSYTQPTYKLQELRAFYRKRPMLCRLCDHERFVRYSSNDFGLDAADWISNPFGIAYQYRQRCGRRYAYILDILVQSAFLHVVGSLAVAIPLVFPLTAQNALSVINAQSYTISIFPFTSVRDLRIILALYCC